MWLMYEPQNLPRPCDCSNDIQDLQSEDEEADLAIRQLVRLQAERPELQV